MSECDDLPVVPIDLDYAISRMPGGLIVYHWIKVYDNKGCLEEECSPHIFTSIETALAFIKSLDDSEMSKLTTALDTEGIVIEGLDR